MSLSSEAMMKLMAYADGELEGKELDEAKRLLATDPDSVRFVEQMSGAAKLTKEGHLAKVGSTLDAFDVSDAVMSRVSAEAPERRDAAAAAAPVSQVPSTSRVMSLDVARAQRNQRMGIGAAVAAALAVAAAVFVYARPGESPMAKGVAQSTIQAIDTNNGDPATSPSSTSAGTGVDVSPVESPGNSVSVFYLPTANELSTSVVVWVEETGEK